MADLRALVGGLNPRLREALEGAAGATLSRTNPEVTVWHVIEKLAQSHETDFSRLLDALKVNRPELEAHVRAALDGLETGHTKTPSFSPVLVEVLVLAETIARGGGATTTCTGHLLLALLSPVGPGPSLLPSDLIASVRYADAAAASADLSGTELGVRDDRRRDHVFCCYDREDAEVVLPIAQRLKDEGVPLWLDQWDLRPSEDWDTRIDWALDTCRMLVLFLTARAIESREVRGELRVALDDNKPVLPLLLEDCRIPRQLRHVQHVDLRGSGMTDAMLSTIANALMTSQQVEARTVINRHLDANRT